MTVGIEAESIPSRRTRRTLKRREPSSWEVSMSGARGICPAMMTAWGSDELYDRAKSEAYVTWLIESGAEALSVCGSTGEMTAMQPDEQAEIIDHVTRFVAGQVPVLASVGKYSTFETLYLARKAKASGVDGLMVLLPYYYKPYKEAAREHLRTVRRETGLPICLYNNPHFAGYEFTTREATELFDEGTIDSIKSAHGDTNRITDLKFFSDMTVFYGHDYSGQAAYAAGADGWLSGFPAAFPKQCRAVQDAIRDERDLDKGKAAWSKFIPFVEYFMDPDTNAEVHWLEILKFALLVQGVDVGFARRPLKELTEAHKAKVENLLETLLN